MTVRSSGSKRRAAPSLRITLLAVALFAPCFSAFGQEAQPFTNTSGDGFRVITADGDGAKGFSFRADGDAGSTKTHVHQTASDKTPSTQLLHGRAAISYDFSESFSAFASVFSSYTALQKSQFDSTQASSYARVNPYHNWGDFAAGARWRTTGTGDARFGAEGGAMFYGAANGFLSAPNFGATSPFVRGLFTWSHDLLRIDANGGVFYDQSFAVWKSVFDSTPQLHTAGHMTASEIYPEERQMLGIYGKSGSVLRFLGGASVGYDLRPARPFLETSFEETDGSLVLRVTPGVSFSIPGKPFHLLLAADLAPLPGDQNVGPIEPGLAVHGALAWELGRNPRSHSPREIARNPNPTPTPAPLARHPTITVEVITDDGKPVRDAKISATDASNAPRSGSTDENGHVTLEETGAAITSIRADHPAYTMLPATLRGPFTAPVKIVAVSKGAYEQVSLEFRDDKGNELPANVVRVTTIWGRTGRTSMRVLGSPASYLERVPATPGQDWKLSIENVSAPGNALSLELNQPGAQISHRYFWDATNSRWTDVAPRAAAEQMIIINVFDPDLADVKPGNAQIATLIEHLKSEPALKAAVTCAVKGSSDPSFAESLAKARGDAFVAYLKAHGIRDAQLSPAKTDIKSEVDSIRVELTK